MDASVEACRAPAAWAVCTPGDCIVCLSCRAAWQHARLRPSTIMLSTCAPSATHGSIHQERQLLHGKTVCGEQQEQAARQVRGTGHWQCTHMVVAQQTDVHHQHDAASGSQPHSMQRGLFCAQYVRQQKWLHQKPAAHVAHACVYLALAHSPAAQSMRTTQVQSQAPCTQASTGSRVTA